MALTLKMWENSRKCVMLLSWQPNANWIQETAGIGVSTFQIGKMDYSPFKNFLLPLTYLGKKKTW